MYLAGVHHIQYFDEEGAYSGQEIFWYSLSFELAGKKPITSAFRYDIHYYCIEILLLFL